MATSDARPVVYVEFVHKNSKMRRVLDLAWINDDPVAVIAWANIDGHVEPADYVKLDPGLLRQAAPPGSWWYEGAVADPRYPEPPGESA